MTERASYDISIRNKNETVRVNVLFEREINELIDLSGVNQLVEMADVMTRSQNYGFLVTVFSNDHNPPHAHIRDLSGKTIGQFLITDAPPQTVNELQLYRTEAIPLKIRKTIAEWANKVDHDSGLIYWATLKLFWKCFQESQY